MPKVKVTAALERIVFNEKRKSPASGVRVLSEVLAKKHGLKISKSAVAKILQSRGIKQAKGRKKAILIYKGKGISDCGLILLRSIGQYIGIFKHLASELKIYFPRMREDLLERFIILASFAYFVGDAPKNSINRSGFLRLAGLSHLPLRKEEYFESVLSHERPTISLKPIKDNMEFVSSIKFYFNNGYSGYTDAKLSTLWDGACRIEDFFLPLGSAVNRLERMLDNRVLILGYAQRFEYLSPEAFNFIKGVNSGIKKIQFLDRKKGVLLEQKKETSKISFFIGYFPAVASKGLVFMGRPKKFKRFFWDELGEFFACNILTRLTQPQEKEGVIMNNVLVKKDSISSPTWGLLCLGNIRSKKADMSFILKRYLYYWPYLERGFLEDMMIIDKYRSSSKKEKNHLKKILPEKLTFSKGIDFIRVGQILSVIFKEIIWGWEPKHKSGNFITGKDYINITLKKVPKIVKKNFNKACFYIDKKRAFIT